MHYFCAIGFESSCVSPLSSSSFAREFARKMQITGLANFHTGLPRICIWLAIAVSVLQSWSYKICENQNTMDAINHVGKNLEEPQQDYEITTQSWNSV